MDNVQMKTVLKNKSLRWMVIYLAAWRRDYTHGVYGIEIWRSGLFTLVSFNLCGVNIMKHPTVNKMSISHPNKGKWDCGDVIHRWSNI
jgi:hypothetical protein